MKYLFIILLCSITTVLSAQTSYPELAKIYTKYAEFQKELSLDDGDIHVVNFWATWCGPCVKELPYFEALHQKYKDQGVKVTLVSLDFVDKIEKKVIPFLQKKNYDAEVMIFDDPRSNEWIVKIDPKWSGAIPITIFYKGEKRIFKEQDFHSLEELEVIINSFR